MIDCFLLHQFTTTKKLDDLTPIRTKLEHVFTRRPSNRMRNENINPSAIFFLETFWLVTPKATRCYQINIKRRQRKMTLFGYRLRVTVCTVSFADDFTNGSFKNSPNSAFGGATGLERKAAFDFLETIPRALKTIYTCTFQTIRKKFWMSEYYLQQSRH